LDEVNLGFRVLKGIHYYISDAKDHDTQIVQHAFRLYWQFMQERGFFLEHHVVWYDGCVGQFKSARSWFFISRYHNSTIIQSSQLDAKMTWNYFASGHGKGEVDGSGGLLKRKLWKEQLKPNGMKFQNAHEVVSYLRA
jgi:hypothetical protein